MTECHWCDKDRDDGEELGDGWSFVCRECIRHMGKYKSELDYMFVVADYLELDCSIEELDEELVEVLESHVVGG